MLRTKLFLGFAALIGVFGLLSACVGVRAINTRMLQEAQTRVELDLNSAWAVYDSKLNEVGTILKLVAGKESVADMCEAGNWNDSDVRSRIERVRVRFGLDFLDIVSPDCQVRVRTAQPYAVGDFKTADPVVAVALSGDAVTCTAVLSRRELEKEADGLADRAFLEVQDTPRARSTLKKEESRGMVLVGAVPVEKGGRVLAAAYGGILLNRNHAFIERIRDVVFEDEEYKGVTLGTATVFMDDMRVATTVRQANGNRAVGTRVSKEVAERVLDSGESWIGDAFVVKDWYITAYDPIKDIGGNTVGMFYVGILKRPFQDVAHDLAIRFVFVSVAGLIAALALAFVLANHLTRPLHRLAAASRTMSDGALPAPVRLEGSCTEIDRLTTAFNEMAQTIAERNDRLTSLNQSYMETLGFVSHELKGPLASMTNYIYLLGEQKIGPLNEKQRHVAAAIRRSLDSLVEMVRHYLNLSRIENGDLQPVMTAVAVADEIVRPLVEAFEAQIRMRHMKLTAAIGPEVKLRADMNMTREIFENLVGNGLKYGKDGGELVLTAKDVGGFFEFSVRNEGEGILPENRELVFGKFSRGAGTNTTQREKGTGLGLFITRHLVEAHGGTIRAESKVGEFAEFIFTMPKWRGGVAATGVDA